MPQLSDRAGAKAMDRTAQKLVPYNKRVSTLICAAKYANIAHVNHISKVTSATGHRVEKKRIFFSCTVKGKSSLANFCHEPEIVRIARDFKQVVLCD